jgi:two-component system, response regulator
VSNPIEILLVEDNSADAELTIHALEKNRLVNRIRHIEDGAEALDYLFCRGAHSDRRFDEPPRLILLDLKLLKIDGIGILREIKNNDRTKAIPVILLTSSNEDRDMAAGYQLGVNSYIQKPVDFTQFQDVVKQLGMYWLLVNSAPPASAFSSR